MANNLNIFAGVAAGGASGVSLVWFAPLGTIPPTDAVTPLPSAWRDAGWVTDAGLTVKHQENTKDVTAYGTTSPVRTLVSSSSTTFDVTFLENNPVTQAVYYRKALGSVAYDPTGATTIAISGASLPTFAAVFDMVDGVNHIRAYAGVCAVTARGDQVISSGDPVQYAVTITAYPDSTNNNTSVTYFEVNTALKNAS